jgi:hypothetical protein
MRQAPLVYSFQRTPPSNAPYKLIFEYITRTLQQYGGYAQVSDIADETEFLNTGDALPFWRCSSGVQAPSVFARFSLVAASSALLAAQVFLGGSAGSRLGEL